MKRLVLLFALGLTAALSAQVEVTSPRLLQARRDTLIAPTKNIWHTKTYTDGPWMYFQIFSSNNIDCTYEVAFEDTTMKSTVMAGSPFELYRPASVVKIRSNGSATATFVINAFKR